MYREKPQAGIDYILEVEDVRVEFGGVVAVDGAGFRLRPGEILAVIGPNGAGKTSLLNVVSGFYKPRKGRVVFEGRDITRLPPHARARLGLARTFQHSELFRHMTVVENIMAGLEPWRSYSIIDAAFWTPRAQRWEEWAREKAERVIDLLELHEYRDRVVEGLPPGVQKRVDLARALAQDPKVVLMDEPMAGLSREEKEDLARAIVEVNETRGISFVLVEHDLEVVMDLCDRVVVMDSGRVIAEGPPSKVANDPRVIEAYIGG
ncbi:ABC transporter ATP-binding protein [Pyrodictium occultum]|uniref:Probable branched-chain amino acid transport ATP-binding protein LivG n=1 Tax=Pyrodictium occultum TaxID=2309 RepID=A0A0V8RX72_PYROC|nr:ABC transporter ATP-binding protein [Pyrodictium occultum]